MKDSLEVVGISAAYATVTLTNIELVVKIVAGLLTIGFIIYKWYKATKH